MELIRSKNGWLNDTIIDLAQMYLRQQFPQSGGLHQICLGLTYTFPVQSTEFVQVLHNGFNHFVTVSTIGTSKGQVLVFDSGKHPHLTKSLIRQILCLVPFESVETVHIKVQQQVGHSDCGLFAIAFATALLHDYTPGIHNFDQNRMRKTSATCSASKYKD